MKSLRYLTSAVAGLGLLVASAVSHAVVMDPTLAYGDSYYLGQITDGVPSNPTDEVNYINNLITLGTGDVDSTIDSETYDRTNSTLAGPFDTAVLADAFKDESETNAISTVDTYQYVLAKYDAHNAGTWVWYSDEGFTGDITVPLNFDGNQYGVSHVALYNRTAVPEPSTLAMLGIGLLALGTLRLRKKAVLTA